MGVIMHKKSPLIAGFFVMTSHLQKQRTLPKPPIAIGSELEFHCLSIDGRIRLIPKILDQMFKRFIQLYLHGLIGKIMNRHCGAAFVSTYMRQYRVVSSRDQLVIAVSEFNAFTPREDQAFDPVQKR